MRQFFVTTLLAGVLAAQVFVFPVIQPASAATKLTQSQQAAIYLRCKKSGGTGKACCAAAEGTWKPDPIGAGGTCDLGGASLKQLPGGRILLAPNKALTAP